MFAKIINAETKEVMVGLGTNADYYRSIGMTEMEVEQAYNGRWYVKGFAPTEPEEEIKKRQKVALQAELDTLDLKTIRALRAISAGTGTPDDQAKLNDLETEAEDLRRQIKELGV